jgi:hypothetical protein
MNEATRQKLLYVVLGVVLIWAAYNVIPPDEPTVVQPLETIRPLSPAAAEHSGTPLIDIAFHEAEPWGKDPFRVVRKTKRIYRQQKWVVSGIVYNQQSPRAFINKKACAVGEVVDNAKVISIQKNSVKLEYKGKQFTIPVSRG